MLGVSPPPQVEALDPETARAVVRLQLGGQAVTVSQHSLTAHRESSQYHQYHQ